VVLLGDVGQRQEVGERPGQRQGLVGGQRRQHAAQALGRLPAARSRPLGQRPHSLDQGVQVRPLVRPEDLPQQIAQQPHVVAQAIVDPRPARPRLRGRLPLGRLPGGPLGRRQMKDLG
jgi:hypothetical protein